jgi:Uncharacterized protein conserved in bacteria (DUF2313).
MLVFNNQQRSGYEEIASYSPRYYRSIKEMDAVFRLAGWLTDIMAQDMENMVAFQFLKYMNDEALTRYEAFLGITKDPNKKAEERKSYINALLIGSGKLSADKIISIINQFVDCECNIELSGTELYINMTFKDNPDKYMDYIRSLIKGKVPAHIEIIYHGSEGLDIVVQITNTMMVERMRHRMDFYLYSNGGIIYLNGTTDLDGGFLLESHLELFPVRDRHRIEITQEESVEAEPILIKRNLNYLDGSIFLDGSTTLNAAEWKEEI